MKILILLILISTTFLYSQVTFINAFPNLSFNRPLDLQNPADGTNRVFVVSQQGYIYSFANDSSVSSTHTFLDISDSVSRVGNEEGLLGMAFHPDYQNNGFFYVYYSKINDNKSIIARYSVSTENPDSAVLASQLIIMEVQQPARNHNGGQLAFAADGYLYIALGDGGGSGDQYNNGQNLETLLGSILRINVNNTSHYGNYAIPEDNPFAGNDSNYREEIYAYGLRNPWRFSFDPVTGWLWSADVGQNNWEEVNIIESGQNYGWNIMEGMHCYNSFSCNESGLTYPVIEYSHSYGYSISGGHVYRGSNVPYLYGKYIYADYGSTRLWSLDYDGLNDPINEELMVTDLRIAGFGIDQNYELYACAFNGKIYKLKNDPSVSLRENEIQIAADIYLDQNYPNPFNPSTTISYNLHTAAKTTLDVYDIKGRRVANLINDFRNAGNYTVLFNGSNLSSGIYFYKLESGSLYRVKQMLLIK